MTTILTLDEAANRLRISRRSLTTLISQGRIRTIHPTPGRTCVLDSEIDAYIASLVKRVA